MPHASHHLIDMLLIYIMSVGSSVIELNQCWWPPLLMKKSLPSKLVEMRYLFIIAMAFLLVYIFPKNYQHCLYAFTQRSEQDKSISKPGIQHVILSPMAGSYLYASCILIYIYIYISTLG